VGCRGETLLGKRRGELLFLLRNRLYAGQGGAWAACFSGSSGNRVGNFGPPKCQRAYVFRAIRVFPSSSNLSRSPAGCRLSGVAADFGQCHRWSAVASVQDFAASLPATGGSLPPPGPR
jgi:hypothetical protein